MEEAFNCIYEKYRSLVYYVAFDILHSREDAEDITNDTFLKMYESRSNLKSEKSLKYLLVTISRNLSINKTKKKEFASDILEEVVPSNEIHDDFTSFVSQFKDYLDKEELDIIVFHLLYGFSFKEIATDQKVTTSVISSKYRRAIQKLKKQYKEKKV